MIKSNDQQFLSRGRSMSDEMRDSHKALADLWQGISLFSNIKDCVTVYGSARFKEDHPYYQMARRMGKALAENGFTVMTGGGPGVGSRQSGRKGRWRCHWDVILITF
jgi:hypothetical protein